MSSDRAGGTPGSGAVSDRLQALLARAAEEQLVEQRQVSSVLGELRALVEDVDERLATGEQVERVAAEVRALSARVEGRLDAADARFAELAERISEATEMISRAAQDLVAAVSSEVDERVEAQLRKLTASTAASFVTAVEGSERRLATHVDDAVLVLAEVVLRRRRSGAPAVPPPASAVDAPAAGRVDEPSVRPQVPDPLDRTAEDDPMSPSADAPTPPSGDGVPDPTRPAAVGLDAAAVGRDSA